MPTSKENAKPMMNGDKESSDCRKCYGILLIMLLGIFIKDY